MNNKKNILLPFIILKDLYIFPSFSKEVSIGKKNSLNACKYSIENNQGKILVLFDNKIKGKNDQTTSFSSFLPRVGVLCQIKIKKPLPSENLLIEFTSLERVLIDNWQIENEVSVANYQIKKNQKLKISERKKMAFVLKSFLMKSGQQQISDQFVEKLLQNEQNLDKLLNLFLQNYSQNKSDFKQEALEEDNLYKKLQLILKKSKFKPLKNINLKSIIDKSLNERVKDRLSNQQREFLLREKLRAIKEELGEISPTGKDVDDYLNKLKKNFYPEYIVKKINKEIRRLEILPQHSPEVGLIKNYIDTLFSIPWFETTKEINSLSKAKSILDKSHFGLKKAKERIIEHLAAGIYSKKVSGQIICLVGPPGVGKTSLGESIAESLNKNYVRIALGGVKDESEIRGHRRTYLGAMPGKIIRALIKVKTTNPVILIDEIDKISSDFRGDPGSAMLEVLDPEQNKTFVDHYVEENYDLSKILFIATANYFYDIPQPLIDRMEIVFLSSYTELEKNEIAKKYLIPSITKEMKLQKIVFFEDEAINEIIKFYTREAGVRELKRLLTKVCRKVIVKLLTKKKEEILKISKKDINKYFGPRIHEYSLKNKKSEIGVVTGLAYSIFGGDILPIETTIFKGSGKLILTGKLGEVMQESAQIAFDYIKSKASFFDIPFELFTKNDFHIHVPGGAVPKDGPSGGVTLTTALISLLKNEKVSNDIAMTGEITLRGNVLPIGGLKEKAISALRSGIKTIFIPSENKKNIKDLPNEVKKSLKIVFVSKYQEIYRALFQESTTKVKSIATSSNQKKKQKLVKKLNKKEQKNESKKDLN